MAKRKKKFNLGLTLLVSIFASVIGLCCGLVAPFYVFSNYFNITTDIIESNDLFYSKPSNSSSVVGSAQLTGEEDLSIHFLELGNKYTGDCTLIKVGDVEVLIDCGSKTSSIATVSNYINQYCTDGILEYVIVTHAHQDHYAGFATPENVKSIFDLYECKNIITFANTNQKETSTMYKNFNRELEQAKTATAQRQGANHFTALDCYNETNGAQRVFELSSSVNLEILYNPFYEQKASTENNYSVCAMVNFGEKHFLFTGDLEAEGEKEMANRYKQDKGVQSVDVEVYKAGHHGSKTSSSLNLLNVFKPKIVCVCCCAGSSEYTDEAKNQFPTQDFINNVALFTDKVYVTTLCIDYKQNLFESFNGNIAIIVKQNNVQTVCSNNDILLKDSNWFKNISGRQVPPQWA